MSKYSRSNDLSCDRQHGVALVIGLVFLLLMTLIGLHLSRSSTLELRMAGNAGAKAVSFEFAEDVRMEAEQGLEQLVNNVLAVGVYDCSVLGAGYYARAGQGTSCSALGQTLLGWDATDSIVSTSYADRRYAIEYLGKDQVFEIGDDVETGTGGQRMRDVYVFRVVGYGKEPSGSSSTVETFFIVYDPNPSPAV